MTDTNTPEQRSFTMSKIKSRDTKFELKLKDLFEKKGFIYQPQEYGRPDFINYKKKTVIFLDSCFWHKCPLHCREPKSNRGYWASKLEHNSRRDKEVTLNYKFSGWKVIRIWEHDLSGNIFSKVHKFL